MVTRIHKK